MSCCGEAGDGGVGSTTAEEDESPVGEEDSAAGMPQSTAGEEESAAGKADLAVVRWIRPAVSW